MRAIATIAALCLLSFSAHATGGPDSVRVLTSTGYEYVSAPAATAKRHAQAQKAKPVRIAKTRTLRHADRSIFQYAIDQQGNTVGFNSGSASCLPASVKARLAEVEARFGKVSIVSTFRRGARIAGSGHPSLHADCRAVDFKVRGNQAGAAAWLKATHEGGVGTYSGQMSHIHIDNGPPYRWHHCIGCRRRS
jgi:hypothetical protein